MQQNRKREEQIHCRVTKEELEQFKKKVQQSKLNQSEYLIKCVLDKKIYVIEDITELVKEIKRIGNNVNQLARSVNSYENVSMQKDIRDMKLKLDVALDEVIRALKEVN